MEGINLSQETKLKLVNDVLKKLNSFVKFRGKRLTIQNVINFQANALAKFLEGEGKYHSFIDRW